MGRRRAGSGEPLTQSADAVIYFFSIVDGVSSHTLQRLLRVAFRPRRRLWRLPCRRHCRLRARLVHSNEVPVPRPRPPINTDAAALPRETMLRGSGERMMRTPGSLSLVVPVATSAAAYAEERQEQAITIGPWTIGTSYKADKFDSCSMSLLN